MNEGPRVVHGEDREDEPAQTVSDVVRRVVPEGRPGEVQVDGPHALLPLAAPSAGARPDAVLASISSGSITNLDASIDSTAPKPSESSVSRHAPSAASKTRA